VPSSRICSRVIQIKHQNAESLIVRKNRRVGINEKDPGSGLVQSWRFRIETSVISLLGHRHQGSASSCLKTAEVVAVAKTVGLGSACL
jgi:hypothetical protein